MEEQIIQAENKMKRTIESVVEAVKNQVVRLSKSRLRKGLRDGRDNSMWISQMEYGVEDILRGKAEAPSGNYKIGRYMVMASKLVNFGARNGDVNSALTGARIYEWLDQGNRQSVHNKVQKAYDKAKQISTQYGAPLSTSNDRAMSVISLDSEQGVKKYLGRNTTNLVEGGKK